MNFLYEAFNLFLEEFLRRITNFLATFIQRFFYLIFKFAAIENPDVLKLKVSPDKVRYFLFTKDDPEHYVEIDTMYPVQLNNPNVKIVFIIHGWKSSREVEWYEELKNALLLKKESFYVVQVDWSIPASNFYALASWSTKDVGNFIGKFIVALNRDYSVPLSNFLIVGYSLGAQVAGFVGKKVVSLTQQKLQRIVALDPVGPLFNTRARCERLNKHDAEIVQVIHKDGDTFGFKYDLHKLNFFLNKKNFQPGYCKVALISLMGQVKWSHDASPKYFAKAVADPDAFMATRCYNWENYIKGICNDELRVSIGDLEANVQGNFYFKLPEEAEE